MRILLIEDEFALADAVANALKNENYIVDIVTSGEDGLNEALTNIYDLILLDIMLPKINGFEILNELRKEKIDSSIIMLTAKSELEDKLNGLDNGADDYITKPFHIKELVSRVKAILRRKENIQDINILEYGDLKLNLDSCEISTTENAIKINGKELEIIEMLILNKNLVVKRESLANKIWGYDSEAEYNNVEVYISFIRKKLKILKSNVKIKAIRGIGYKLEVNK